MKLAKTPKETNWKANCISQVGRHNIVRMQTPQISEGLGKTVTNGRTVITVEVFLKD